MASGTADRILHSGGPFFTAAQAFADGKDYLFFGFHSVFLLFDRVIQHNHISCQELF